MSAVLNVSSDKCRECYMFFDCSRVGYVPSPLSVCSFVFVPVLLVCLFLFLFLLLFSFVPLISFSVFEFYLKVLNAKLFQGMGGPLTTSQPQVAITQKKKKNLLLFRDDYILCGYNSYD